MGAVRHEKPLARSETERQMSELVDKGRAAIESIFKKGNGGLGGEPERTKLLFSTWFERVRVRGKGPTS